MKTSMQELLDEVILERQKSISVEFRDALDFVINAIKTDYIEQPKQETLEEASEKWLNKDGFNIYNHYDTRPSFIAGAKWQQEQDENKYSEEDLKYAFDSGRVRLTFDKERPFVFKNYEEFIEQFKNK